MPATTLMGLAEHPGELGSWGPVLADVARNMAHDLATAPWRCSVTDDAGRVIWNGPIRRRPTAGDAAYVKARDRRCRFPGVRHEAPCIEGGERPSRLAVAAAGVKLGAA